MERAYNLSFVAGWSRWKLAAAETDIVQLHDSVDPMHALEFHVTNVASLHLRVAYSPVALLQAFNSK